MENTVAVVLAAGMGTRMKSDLPKVLHPILGKPMLYYVLRAIKKTGIEKIKLVVGYKSEMIKDALDMEGIEFIIQEPQMGTGHALQVAMPSIGSEFDYVLVHAGICPDRPSTLEMLMPEAGEDTKVSVLYGKPDEPGDMGRCILSEGNCIHKIVEVADGGPEIRRVEDVNLGAYCFDAKFLREYLPRLKPSKVKGEFYITDLMSLHRMTG